MVLDVLRLSAARNDRDVPAGTREPLCFLFSSRRRHTRCSRDWSSDVCSSDLLALVQQPDEQRHLLLHGGVVHELAHLIDGHLVGLDAHQLGVVQVLVGELEHPVRERGDRKSTRLNSSHGYISYAVFCLKKKLLHFLILILGSVLVLMLPLLVWLTPGLRIKQSLLQCNWTIRKRLPRCKMRLKKRLLAFSRRLHARIRKTIFFFKMRCSPNITTFPLLAPLPF